MIMGHICMSVSVGNYHLHCQGKQRLSCSTTLFSFFKFHVALPLIAGKVNALAKVLVTVGGTRSCLTLVKGKGRHVHVFANLPQNSPGESMILFSVWWFCSLIVASSVLVCRMPTCRATCLARWRLQPPTSTRDDVSCCKQTICLNLRYDAVLPEWCQPPGGTQWLCGDHRSCHWHAGRSLRLLRMFHLDCFQRV